MAAPIDFYFDFASPYGYLASTRIDALAARYGRAVTWRPIMLGPAMKATGGRPPSTVPLRKTYLDRDLPRFARFLGVPFVFPPDWPVAALAAARAHYWLTDDDPELARRLSQAVINAHWGLGRDIREPEQVAAIAAPLGVDGDALVAAVQSPAVKERLKAEGEASLARGIFGSPFIIVDREPFWGADRLDQVERWLATGGF